MAHFFWQGNVLYLHCYLQPRAASDEFSGLHDDRLKIRITAPPVDGRANAHLIKFIAKQFGVAKSQVSLKSGETSRQKTLAIASPARLPSAASIAADG